ncbi:PAS domain S-box protein, partial [Ideonella sp.]|uniref:PAS domain S-box protein n=1 Tax=Ideonella sp. TaxID=1929293 RepID=UPI003BB68D41
MHGMLALIALLMALGGHHAWRVEQRRAADVEAVKLAGAQRMLTQRIALLSVSPAANEDDKLDAAIQRSQTESLRLETLLKLHGDTSSAGLSPRLMAAVQQWQSSRERLWYRAQSLQRPGGSGSSVPLPGEVARRMQAEAELASNAAQALVDELHKEAQARADSAQALLRWMIVLGGGLLLALALGVVEPTARHVRQQQGRLIRQAAQLERLALVAECTQNAVVITDASRHIVWVNRAFERVSGYTAAETLGKKPASLIQSEETDAATVQRMRAAFDRGEGVRVEILNRHKSGANYWVDIDIQPLRDALGGLTGFIAVETDITAQVTQRLRLQALLAALPTGVVEHDASGVVIETNRAAEEILGLTRDQLFGRSSMDPRWRTVRDDLSPFPGEEHPSARSIATGASVRGEIIGVHKPNGELRWLTVNSDALLGPGGRITGAVACFVDVTERRTQRALLDMALQAAHIGTWHWRVDENHLHWSAESCALMGYSVEEFTPYLANWRERVHPDDRANTARLLKQHLKDSSQPFQCDQRMQHRDGRWVWVQLFGTVVERDLNGRATRMVGVHLDINERKANEQQLRATAQRDALTGLPNRSAVMDRLNALVASRAQWGQRIFAVLFLDFDRFKQVNDLLGHAAGDDLLRQIAGRLSGALRPSDAASASSLIGQKEGATVAARLGGDEFVVLLEGLRHASDACGVADRLLQVLSVPYEVQGHAVHSTASIGIVTSEQGVADADALLSDADTAMYEAKRGGRSRWVMFEPDMHHQASQRAEVEQDLHQALDRDELFVVYQPVLALGAGPGAPSAGACLAVEALVRWRHPARGLIPPLQFIPIAEESGQIDALGRFVLQTACRQFMAWQSELGLQAPASMAVNLSVAQLRQPHLVEHVR